MWLYYGPHLNPSHSQQFRLNQRKRRHGLLLSSIWFFSSLDWQGGVLTWESQQPAFLTPKHHFYTPTSQEHVYGFSTSSTTNLPSLSSGPKYSRVTCRSYEIQRGGRSPCIPHRLTTREPNLIVSGLFSPSATNPIPSLDSKSKPTQATTF